MNLREARKFIIDIPKKQSYFYEEYPFFLFIHRMINCGAEGKVSLASTTTEIYKWVSDNGNIVWVRYRLNLK